MQDQVGAYSPDCAAPSDHSPRRELAPHPSGYHPYSEMGYQDLGRNPSRLRKEIKEIYCKRMASAGAEAILKLNLTKINTNLWRKSRQTFLIILFHLIPMVIRPNICFYRNMNLLLIMQEFHQDITTFTMTVTPIIGSPISSRS